MKFSRNQQPFFQVPKEGNYVARVVGWKEGKKRNTMMGLTPTVIVTFELEDGQRVMQSMLVYSGPKSLLEKLVDSTLGEDADDVELDQLIGKKCGVEIRHNHVGEITYANVVDIFPTSEFGDELDLWDELDDL